MKHLALLTAFGLALATTASASNFSVSGPGGAFPDANGTNTWNVSYGGTFFSSPATVVNPVTSLTSVKLSGLTHTWRGDLRIFLADPAGAKHALVTRPGFTGTGFGDSGDYLVGDYIFVETGGGTVAQGATNISPGTYNQYFNTGAGMWTTGADNVGLSTITGPAGTWTLVVEDWAGGDVGSITGWTLSGTDAGGGPVAFCDPGVGNVVPCPCANAPSGTGRGCNNSAATGGASITAAGAASLGADTLVFSSANQTANGTTIVLQGSATIPSGATFGMGVRCVGGTLKRLYVKSPGGTGGISAPAGGDPSVSAQSAALGDTIAAASHRYYMTYYRDPTLLGTCTLPNTFNGTNALDVTWAP